MNGAHFHILINHFPIIGGIIASAILLIAIFLKHEVIKRVAYCLFIGTALISFPANYSGEQAEETIGDIRGIDHSLVEKHEDAASFALWAAVITGAVSVIALFLSVKENDLKGVLSIVVLGVSLFAIFYMWQTGLTGGKIRHPETNVSPAAITAD